MNKRFDFKVDIFLDKLNKLFWHDDSIIYRFAKRFPFIVYIFGIPVALIIFILVFVPATFIVPPAYILINSFRYLKRFFNFIIKLKVKIVIKICLFFIGQALLSYLLITIGSFIFKIFIVIMHDRSFIPNATWAHIVAIYFFMFIFIATMMKWEYEKDLSKLNLEKEKKEALDNLENVDKDAYHDLFVNEKYLGYRKKMIHAISASSMMSILNISFCCIALFSAFVCHELHYFSSGSAFSNVNEVFEFRDFLAYVFDLVISIIPIDILNIFNFELSQISPNTPYGTALTFIVNSTMAFLFLSFFYALINRIRTYKLIFKDAEE